MGKKNFLKRYKEWRKTANLQGRLCRGRARTAIREINFVGVGAGHKILSSFGVTRQWWMRREEGKDEITAKKLQNYLRSRNITARVYRHPSLIVERPSRVGLRNIFIGRNYTYVHACMHARSLCRVPLFHSHKLPSISRGYVFSVEYIWHTLYLFFRFFFMICMRMWLRSCIYTLTYR